MREVRDALLRAEDAARELDDARNPATSTQAFIGIGGNSNMTRLCGNSMAKASNTPNTPPEAPSVGHDALSQRRRDDEQLHEPPVSTDAKYSQTNRREPRTRSTMPPNEYNANMLSAMCATPPCRNA